MRIIDFLRKNNIGYKTFGFLCQFLGISSPKINTRISNEFRDLLEIKLNTDEFAKFYKLEKSKNIKNNFIKTSIQKSNNFDELDWKNDTDWENRGEQYGSTHPETEEFIMRAIQNGSGDAYGIG